MKYLLSPLVKSLLLLYHKIQGIAIPISPKFLFRFKILFAKWVVSLYGRKCALTFRSGAHFFSYPSRMLWIKQNYLN